MTLLGAQGSWALTMDSRTGAFVMVGPAQDPYDALRVDSGDLTATCNASHPRMGYDFRCDPATRN